MIRADFLPASREDMEGRGWYYYDFLLITGDAYVDHPSFGAAIIGRVLEAEGYRVAVLAQPAFKNASAVASMGRPRYAALVTAGNLDSMVAHYTAAKKRRSEDYYSPGKKPGMRPDRAVIVYSKLVREAFPGLPIIIGGLEASLRRFAHYDYWEDKVRRPILFDAEADFIVYGMGESAITELARRLASKAEIGSITDVRGTGYIAKCSSGASASISEASDKAREDGTAANIPTCPFAQRECASYEEVSKSKKAYAEAALLQHEEHEHVVGKAVIQQCEGRYLVINPMAEPLTAEELDKVYSLPYTRETHPMYNKAGGVAAVEEVRFSVIHNRGCFGNCNFCALAFHQGRAVSSRSHESVIKEIRGFLNHPEFKGYVHDIGGPTANFRKPSCEKQKKDGICVNRSCLTSYGYGNQPKKGSDSGRSPRKGMHPKAKPAWACPVLKADHADYLALLRKAAAIPGVKKVFVRSGIRYDYLMLDENGEFFAELVKNHISGQLKVAPEHCVDKVLYYMGKPKNSIFEKFREKFIRLNARYGKEQYLVTYLISSHPGSKIEDAVALAEYLNNVNIRPEQVQDFYPTPGTLSTCMYYTGIDPRTMEEVYVPRGIREKAAQRALLQWNKPENRDIIRAALREAGRGDLIGYRKHCLVRPKRYGKM